MAHSRSDRLFTNIGKIARETFVQFFSFVFDNVGFEVPAFFPRLSNIHPRLNSFDCIVVYCFSSNLLYFTRNFECGSPQSADHAHSRLQTADRADHAHCRPCRLSTFFLTPDSLFLFYSYKIVFNMS